MPSPRKDESQKKYTSRATFIYEDRKTGELFLFKRRGAHRKNGRKLFFVTKAEGETIPDHILNRTEESYSDEKAGYPPNCNKGYIEKNGKCVPE